MTIQDHSTTLTHPSQRNLAGALDAMMIEKFDGMVHEEKQKDSLTDGLFDMPTLKGTNTRSNAAMGKATLVAVVPGVQPTATQVEVGKAIVQVKVPIIARNTESLVEVVQDRLNIKSRLPKSHGKLISKAKDEILLHKCVQSAMKATGVGEIANIDGGYADTTTLTSLADNVDDTKLMSAISKLWLRNTDNELETSDGLLYVKPSVFVSLLDSDKLMNADYSDNGDFAMARLDKAYNFRIVTTARLPKVAVADHIMGEEYNITAGEALIGMVFAASDAIMNAQMIPLTSDVFWDKLSLTWFIDSYIGFGSAINRPDEAGAIFLDDGV